jgi:exopolysaccharide production protein ExoQ
MSTVMQRSQAPAQLPNRLNANSASPFHLVPVSRLEALVAILTMFLLFVDQPAKWFVNRLSGAAPGGKFLSLFLIAVVIFGFFNLGFRFDRYFEMLVAEPLLPILLGLMLLSALWSGDAAATLDTSVAMCAVVLIAIWMYLRFPLSTIVGLATIACAGAALLNLAFVFGLPRYGYAPDGWMGALLNRNLLGRNSTVAFAVSLVAFRVHRRWRFPLFFAVILNAVLVIGAQSKTSLMGSFGILAMVIIVPALRARRTLYGVVALCFGGIVGGLVYLVYGNLDSLSKALGRDANLTGRTEIWPAVIDAIRERPVWGYGWQGFWTGWSGPSGTVWKKVGFQAAHAHNGLMEVALGLGLVGAGIFLAIYIRTAVRSARVVRYYASPVGMFPLIIIGAVVSTSVTEFGILVRDIFFLLFVIAVLAAARGRKEALAGMPKPGQPTRR